MTHYDLIVVTTPTIHGREITRVLGPVYGITVRSRGVGGQIVAGLQTLAGGEISMYTKECERAREESLRRMVDKARQIGANGMIGADFETSDILQGVATVFASYGTAVVLSEGPEPAAVPQVQAAVSTCSNCGASLPKQAKFCPSCGSRL